MRVRACACVQWRGSRAARGAAKHLDIVATSWLECGMAYMHARQAGATQDVHFQQLFHLLQTLGHEWAAQCQHVNFGQVQGMSTR